MMLHYEISQDSYSFSGRILGSPATRFQVDFFGLGLGKMRSWFQLDPLVSRRKLMKYGLTFPK